MVYVTRSCVIAGDTIVLVLTWQKTFREWNEARRLHMQLSVTTCLLRDGEYRSLLPSKPAEVEIQEHYTSREGIYTVRECQKSLTFIC